MPFHKSSTNIKKSNQSILQLCNTDRFVIPVGLLRRRQ